MGKRETDPWGNYKYKNMPRVHIAMDRTELPDVSWYAETVKKMPRCDYIAKLIREDMKGWKKKHG